MAPLKRILVLTGGRTGTTCVLSKYQFVDGETIIEGDEKQVLGLTRYMGRAYRAFEKGSNALAQAQEVDRKHGISKADTHPQPGGPNSVPSGVQPGGGGPATVPATDSSAADGSAPVAEGSVPSGHGQPDSGEHGTQTDQDRVLKAVNSLDVNDDECWTTQGTPRVDAVANASGLPNVTREDIEAVAPGFMR